MLLPIGSSWKPHHSSRGVRVTEDGQSGMRPAMGRVSMPFLDFRQSASSAS